MKKVKSGKAPPQGWSPTPQLFYRQQSALGLTNNEIALIQHVSSYQYSLKDRPYPRASTLARAMGVSVRAIQKWKASLIQKGLLTTKTKVRDDGTHESSFWDFSPLWGRLQELTPGTQGTLFPDRSGDGGRVNFNGYSGPPRTTVQGVLPENSDSPRTAVHGEPEQRFVDTPNSGSYQEEEEVEEEPKKNKKPVAVASVATQCSDQEVSSADRVKQLVPLELTLELIKPEAMMDEEKAKKIKALEEATKAKSAAAHEVKLAKQAQKAALKADSVPPDVEPAEQTKKVIGSRWLEKIWREEMEAAFPALVIAPFAPKEWVQIKKLKEGYSPEILIEAFRYVVRNWSTINQRVFKGKGTYPSIGMILSLHSTLVLEAQQWAKVRSVIEEYNDFWTANPEAYKIPADLQDRFAEAEKVLKSLGLK
jgi:hypothetical protein